MCIPAQKESESFSIYENKLIFSPRHQESSLHCLVALSCTGSALGLDKCNYPPHPHPHHHCCQIRREVYNHAPGIVEMKSVSKVVRKTSLICDSLHSIHLTIKHVGRVSNKHLTHTFMH